MGAKSRSAPPPTTLRASGQTRMDGPCFENHQFNSMAFQISQFIFQNFWIYFSNFSIYLSKFLNLLSQIGSYETVMCSLSKIYDWTELSWCLRALLTLQRRENYYCFFNNILIKIWERNKNLKTKQVFNCLSKKIFVLEDTHNTRRLLAFHICLAINSQKINKSSQ